MTSSAVGVYLNADTVQYHLCQFKNSQPFVDCEIYREVDPFLSSQHDRRVAVLHVPYPLDNQFSSLVDSLTLCCDHVFITCTELHPVTVDFIHQHDHDKITYYICGQLNFELMRSQVCSFMDWFETSTYFYRHWLPEILNRLKPYSIKPKSFDILLGRPKQHRDFVFERAMKTPGDHVLTYFNDSQLNLNQWQWEQHGVRIDSPIEWTVQPVQYYGHPISVSQILPFNIYNQTAYTVVAETCWQNHFSFFTEKTAKPIIARRLFVVFAGQGHLRNLQRMGFQTFDSIINERYDDEPDDLVRWQRAWDQVEWLKRQPQEAILEEIRPIVEHNFEVMMSRDWYGVFRDQFEQDFARIVNG
jgi:hypothetical protein